MSALTLHIMPRFWGIPNASPYCVKLETWLRMARIPHEVAELTGPPASKTGKAPYVDLPDGERIADSARIIEVLTERHRVKLDDDLDAGQRALSHAITRTVEDGLYFTTLYARWKDDAGFATTAGSYFNGAPALVRGPLAWWIRRSVLSALHGHGLGREDLDWANRRGLADLAAISEILGDQEFFLGARPHTVDAAVFGPVTNLRHAPYPGPLRDAVLADERLCAWEERMRERFWPDWVDLPR